jgi:aspartyl-tRNA synthetase
MTRSPSNRSSPPATTSSQRPGDRRRQIRIHRQEVQSKVFTLLGISARAGQGEVQLPPRSPPFGAPPHGGIAFGLDRLVMHFCGTDNIRDVIAFPKTQTGADLMSAPNVVDADQLRELHVRSTAPAPAAV